MLLQLQNAYLMDGEWTGEVTLQLRSASEWRVIKLHISRNSWAGVVKQIAHIHFPNLTILDLSLNRIQSIEGLSHADMPRLQEIMLNQNHIISVKVLRKTAWPVLNKLNIQNNLFWDSGRLTQGCFPRMRGLYLFDRWKEDKNRFTESCFLPKMPAPSLLYMSANKNIFSFHRSIQPTLERKWEDSIIQ